MRASSTLLGWYWGERAALRAQINMLHEMHHPVTADRDELLQRLHRAELKLELYASGELKPPGV